MKKFHVVSSFACLLLAFVSSEDKSSIFLDGFNDAISVLPLNDHHPWGRSDDFTVEIWFRPERKEKDDHEEQCILSQGSWEGRFKLSVLPWRVIRFTVRNIRGGVIDCDGDTPLQPRRWYHISATYDASQNNIFITLNGDQMNLKCNPIQVFENILPANKNTSPLLIGCCANPEQSSGNDHISGTVYHVRYWLIARSLSQIQGSMHARFLSTTSSDLLWSSLDRNSKTRRVLNEKHELVSRNQISSRGSLDVTPYGHPLWVDTDRGDQILSSLLTGSEEKGARSLVSYATMDHEDLKHTLQRYFSVKETERSVWLELMETRSRLEALNEFIAMSFQQQFGQASQVRQFDADGELKNIKIALIAPATTHGIIIDNEFDFTQLPLCVALLSSLYNTCEAEFEYTVMLAVNQDDVLARDDVVDQIFHDCSEKFSEKSLKCIISHEKVVLPSSLIPSHSLSTLFNLPTLKAHALGFDYFYLANDDLVLSTDRWTSTFVNSLKNNPIWSNLGVAGGADVSDEVTPQIEFPFFHRTHVTLFHWCGANPSVFRNWFEDNWLTDIYIPFNSVFYFKDVHVSNYGGLLRPNEAQGSRDPRYLIGGRSVPSYYLFEVEAARKRILNTLQSWGAASSDLPLDLTYCATTGTLGQMPVGPHQPVLDVCDDGAHSDERRFIPTHEVMVKEIGYTPYADILATLNSPLPLTPKQCQGEDEARDVLRIRSVQEEKGEGGSNVGLNVLVVHHHIPIVSRYGCDVRLLQVVTSLQSLGHQLLFGGKHVSDFETEQDKANLKQMNIPVYTPLADGEKVNRVKTKAMLRHNFVSPIQRRKSSTVQVVFMSLWFWSTTPIPQDFLPLVRMLAPSAKIVILTDDVHFHRLSLMSTDANKIEDIMKREFDIYQSADQIACITEEDVNRIKTKLLALNHNQEISNQLIHRLPMVANRKYDDGFDAYKEKSIRNSRTGLVMVGNGANPANVASAEWFIYSIWPKLRKKLCELKELVACEDVTFKLIGADWKKEYHHEAGVILKGFLSEEELTAQLASSLVFVSPIVAATGLNTKNILALEHGVPLVTTGFGAEGMNLVAGISTPPVLVANTVEEFTAHVVRLYTNDGVWLQQRDLGSQHLELHFSHCAMKESLNEMMLSLYSPRH